MKKIIIAGVIFCVAFFCWSCTKQVTSYVPQPTPFPYPATYNFPDVNYTNQQAVLDTIDNLMAAVDYGNIQGNIVDSAALRITFNNTIASTGLSLSGLCVDTAAQNDILRYFVGIGKDSHSTVTGSNGVPGVGASTTEPGVSYLQSDSGFVYRELVKTAIMEGILAYKLEHTLHDSIYNSPLTVDLQNNWDAAFGYFDVPVGFPVDTVGAKYWGRYAKNLSALGLDTVIMDNFLIGRSAIGKGFILAGNAIPANANYFATEDANYIINALDLLVVGAAIHELGQAESYSVSDPVLARAYLSSSWGFLYSLKYNVSPNRTTNTVVINSILASIGTNLYVFPNVDSIKTVIGNQYGFTSTDF